MKVEGEIKNVASAMQQCVEKILLLSPISLNMEQKKGQYDGGLISQIGLMSSFASIFGSLYIYFIADDQQLGIFVGLWAPTLILISREVDKMMGWMAE